MKLEKTLITLKFFLFVIIISSNCFAQVKTITSEMIVNIRNISEVQLSPDSKNIIFQTARQRQDDENPGPQLSEIWMMNTNGGNPFRFTYNTKSDQIPRWSPDGKLIAFISTRGESDKAQIFLIPFDGGEAVQLTNVDNSLRSIKWSNEGNKIAFLMTDPKSKEDLSNEKTGKDWIITDKNFKYSRLYTANVNTKEVKLITTGNNHVYDYDWSPDDNQFVIAASDSPLTDHSYMFVKLLTVSAEGGESKLVTKTEGKLSSPRWSPDGKWIAYLGATLLKDGFAGSVFIVPPGGGSPENITTNLEQTATWISWIPKSSILSFITIDRQDNRFYSVNISDKKINPVFDKKIYFNSVSFNSDGLKMAFAANTSIHPNEIFFSNVNKPNLIKLTNFNPQLNGLTFGKQKIFKWKSIDDLDIEGVLVYPVGYEKGKRYPTVLQAHGGPESAYLNGWNVGYHNWAQQLAAAGYVVFMPNYRGSIGRGAEFCMGDHRDLMGKEFFDMLTGIDYLITKGITDGEKVGIGGGSYGGLTAAWAATFASQRFKASVATMAITNWVSYMGTTDIFWENTMVHWDMVMYNHYDFFWERSPLKHIHNANTPTLLLHGQKDLRVPISQSQELYTALKWKGVPTEFVAYPRAEHGMGEKAQQLDIMYRVQDWFDRYLK